MKYPRFIPYFLSFYFAASGFHKPTRQLRERLVQLDQAVIGPDFFFENGSFVCRPVRKACLLAIFNALRTHCFIIIIIKHRTVAAFKVCRVLLKVMRTTPPWAKSPLIFPIFSENEG